MLTSALAGFLRSVRCPLGLIHRRGEVHQRGRALLGWLAWMAGTALAFAVLLPLAAPCHVTVAYVLMIVGTAAATVKIMLGVLVARDGALASKNGTPERLS